jgi:hypothetical protein
MRESIGPWVVYLMTISKNPDGMRAVCEQSEWDAMELNRPGYHKLMRRSVLGGERIDECQRVV